MDAISVSLFQNESHHAERSMSLFDILHLKPYEGYKDLKTPLKVLF